MAAGWAPTVPHKDTILPGETRAAAPRPGTRVAHIWRNTSSPGRNQPDKESALVLNRRVLGPQNDQASEGKHLNEAQEEQGQSLPSVCSILPAIHSTWPRGRKDNCAAHPGPWAGSPLAMPGWTPSLPSKAAPAS